MNKGIVLGIIILVIGMSFTGSSYSLSMSKSQTLGFDGNILYVGGSGEGNYTTIQGAIDDTVDGDTVFVYDDSAPYWESVVVDKSIKLIGEDRNTTRIRAKGDSTVCLQAPNITLTEFKITDCNMVNEGGVDIQSSFNNVHHNVIINNVCGIYVNHYNDESYGNQIHHNIINCNDSSDAIEAILLIYTSYQKIYANTISAYGFGIALWSASNNSIYKNKILCNAWGIEVYDSSNNNLIYNNYISENLQYGINIYFYSSQNIIYRNQLVNTRDYGIKLSSDDNFIYHNNFINNSKGHAVDEGNNTWDNGYPSGGNFWDDYTGEDSDGDGIGDTPYPISGGDNVDRYPLGNFRPDTPTIEGPTHGKPGVDYDYTFVTTDPEGDDIWYHISWGDKEIIYIYGPYPSGEEITLSYNWSEKGTYIISCWARDIYDAESNITTLEVKMPRDKANYYSLYLRFLERFPLLQRLLDIWRSFIE